MCIILLGFYIQTHFYLRSGHGGASRQLGKACVAPGNCRGVYIRGDGVTATGGWRCKEKLRLHQVSTETNLTRTHTRSISDLPVSVFNTDEAAASGSNQVPVTH